MRVLVADDETKVRSAIILLLKQRPDITDIYEADSLATLQHLIQQYTIDVVLLDWELGKEGGKRALKILRAAQNDIVVITLSSHPEARDEALQAGANAFVSKGDPPEHLLKALRTQKAPSQSSKIHTQTTGPAFYAIPQTFTAMVK